MSTLSLQSEPARIIGLITAAVTSVLALIVAFGVELTTGQTAGILGVIAGVGPLVAAFVIRGKVYAPDTVHDMVATGVREGVILGGDAERENPTFG